MHRSNVDYLIQGSKARSGFLALSFLLVMAGIVHSEEALDVGELKTLMAENPAVVFPDVPALNVNTVAIQNGDFTAPHIPPVRTSNDGRVGMYIKRLYGATRRFTLLRPEALDKPFDQLPSGIPAGLISDFYDQDIGYGHHATLCDGSSDFADLSEQNASVNGIMNPRQCGSNDCYNLSVIGNIATTENVTLTDGNIVLKAGTRITRNEFVVEVAAPKTQSANIVNITHVRETRSEFMPRVDAYLEPMFTADGRVLVFRMKSRFTTQLNASQGGFQWIADDGSVNTGTYDMVYAVIPKSADACDVTQLQGPFPVSHAPYHNLVNQTYGFAQHPFRDTEGNNIEDGAELKGTYPWIDRGGRNLFFTALYSPLYYNTGRIDPVVGGGIYAARYDARCIDNCDEMVSQDTFHTQGAIVMGGWTKGKMVMLDGAFSNSDYGLAVHPSAQRDLALYSDAEGDKVWERVGSIRDTQAENLPLQGAKNTSFMDSLENLFNGHENFLPATPRDVVWRLSTGRGTADVAFDDYINEHSIIVTNMNASLTHDVGIEGEIPTSYTRNNINMRHNDGFEHFYTHGGKGFTLAPRIQNAATSLGSSVPDYGRTHGNIRIEPISKGGITGKGLWLDGSSGVSFYINEGLSQSRPGSEAFVSVFVDLRSRDSEPKRLLSFPDGSVLTISKNYLRYLIASNGVEFEAVLPDLSHDTNNTDSDGWMHVALQFNADRSAVDVFLNGYLLAQWLTPTHTPLMQGELVLGALIEDSMGVRGWLDEFKVFSYRPDLESVCNHAHGTLMGFEKEEGSPKWFEVASRYPQVSHDIVSQALTQRQYTNHKLYACVHNYGNVIGTANALALERLANPLLMPLRQIIQFPEGPLYWDEPRPDSLHNSFCLECHFASTNFSPLSLQALVPVSNLVLQHDVRRQPMQPPRAVMGHVAASLGACQYNFSLLGEPVTLSDSCFLNRQAPNVVSDITYRIIHVASGNPIRVETWDQGNGHDQQGYPVTLEPDGVDGCDGAECDFKVEDRNDGFQSINPTNDIITRPLGVLGMNFLLSQGQENVSGMILRRSARYIQNCPLGDCDFKIVSVGANRFRIEPEPGYSLTAYEYDTRIQITNTEACQWQKCDFEFVPLE